MKKSYRFIFQNLVVIPIAFVLCIQNPLLGQAQNAEDSVGTIRAQKFDARSLSMGSATLADVYGRASMGINPALSGLGRIRNAVQLNIYHNWDINVMQYDLSLSTLSLDNHHLSLRIGTTQDGINSISYLGSAPLPQPELDEYHVDVGYAYSIGDYFSVGTLQSLYYTYNDDAQILTYSADIGIVYAPEGIISYGMALRGLGRRSTYEIIGTGQTILQSSLLTQSLEVGATIVFPDVDQPYFSMSFANEKRFGEDGLWYKGGIEILPLPFVALRSGLLFHLDQSVFIPRYGIGIQTGHFRMDYVVAPKNLRGEHFHQVALTIEF